MDVVSLLIGIAAIIFGAIFLVLMFIISGKPGPVGPQGFQGAQGSNYTGDGTGNVGLQGFQGTQGPVGNQGFQGLPGLNNSTQTFKQEVLDYGGGNDKTITPTASTVYTLTNLSRTTETVLNLTFNPSLKQGAVLIFNLNGNVGDSGKRKVVVKSQGFLQFKKGSQSGTTVQLNYFRDSKFVTNSSYTFTLDSGNTFLVTTSEPYNFPPN